MDTTILIIDDEPDMSDMIAYHLRKHHLRVLTAVSGKDGVHCAQLELPNLIILDLMLPDMDGFATCEILRRLPSTKSIPILMLTALSGGETRQHGFRCGVDAFMNKPFKIPSLTQQVSQMLVTQEAMACQADEQDLWVDRALGPQDQRRKAAE